MLHPTYAPVNTAMHTKLLEMKTAKSPTLCLLLSMNGDALKLPEYAEADDLRRCEEFLQNFECVSIKNLHDTDFIPTRPVKQEDALYTTTTVSDADGVKETGTHVFPT